MRSIVGRAAGLTPVDSAAPWAIKRFSRPPSPARAARRIRHRTRRTSASSTPACSAAPANDVQLAIPHRGLTPLWPVPAAAGGPPPQRPADSLTRPAPAAAPSAVPYRKHRRSQAFTAKVSRIRHRSQVRYSWHPGCPVALSGLRLITMTYRGFDHRVHTGRLVVNAALTGKLILVFRKLFAVRYPIRRMVPVGAYHGSDFASIQADNRCRKYVDRSLHDRGSFTRATRWYARSPRSAGAGAAPGRVPAIISTSPRTAGDPASVAGRTVPNVLPGSWPRAPGHGERCNAVHGNGDRTEHLAHRLSPSNSQAAGRYRLVTASPRPPRAPA